MLDVDFRVALSQRRADAGRRDGSSGFEFLRILTTVLYSARFNNLLDFGKCQIWRS
jgi:hypothetical protein